MSNEILRSNSERSFDQKLIVRNEVALKTGRFVLSIFVAITVTLLSGDFLHAQRSLLSGIEKARIDYPGPISYSPSDPQTRSKRFKMQTGHFGLFYNCDREESKRNSPYICWKSQHCADWRNGACASCKRDRADIKQRLIDGSCSSCQTNVAKQNCGCCSCQKDEATSPQSIAGSEGIATLEYEDSVSNSSQMNSAEPSSSPRSPRRTRVSQIIRSWGDSPSTVNRLQAQVAQPQQPQVGIIAKAPLDFRETPIQRNRAVTHHQNRTGKISTQQLVVRPDAQPISNPALSLIETAEIKNDAPQRERVRVSELAIPVIR